MIDRAFHTLPDISEVRLALRTIERADQAIVEMMVKAGIPRPSCHVTEGVSKSIVAVHLRSSERLFKGDGKINCQNGYAGYDRIAEAIDEAANNLQMKKTRRRT